MKPFTTSSPIALICLALLSVASLSRAILVQPHNFAPDDQDQETSAGYLFDQDLLKLARLRDARMLQADAPESDHVEEHFSQEMADLIHREHQHQIEKQTEANMQQSEPSLSASVAHVLMNVARAAQVAQAEANEEQQVGASDSSSVNSQQQQQQPSQQVKMSQRGSILELDTSGPSAGSSMPAKSDLKQSAPKQWFNPKEAIPVLKISSMATPSKYKKVYFRAEKKLVDGAFQASPSNEKEDKKSMMKSSSAASFNSGVQRRSSRGTSSSVPPGILQDGVIDFLKKFRDVYIQTRPVNTASASSSLASSFLASAASSPLASILSPSASGSSRPNLASAISAATSMMSSAAQVAQAASSAPTSGSSADSSSAATGAAGNSAKAPLSAQTYVSFWSKTFPTWVRKMLKQMRRRSLHNSSKRHQQHHHHSSSIGQAAQAAANVASAVEQSGGSSSSGGASSSKQT